MSGWYAGTHRNDRAKLAKVRSGAALWLATLVPLGLLSGCAGFVSGNNTVQNPLAPTITTQPANQTVTVGQTATFTIMASGTAPLSYQWQKNGANITGATSASYTTPATTTADSGAIFNVVVSNSVGTATSNAATLTVNASAVAPSIAAQPTNQTVTVGQTATFTVTASGTPPLSYQWQKNGVNIGGATSASYTTPATTTADSGATFKVVVSNSAGAATSNAATLTVNASAVPPSITAQPANQTVTAGQTATFTVTASGTAPLSYQWQKNGVNIAGATSASYRTPATTTADSGATFKVAVSNSAGSVTSNAATLTVNASAVAPSITAQPTNQMVTAGQTATFTVAASGTAPLSYQWQKNGVNIAGATSASYTTPATTTSDSGSTFVVMVSNSAGTATSNAATLTVNTAPVAPAITAQPANQTVTAGQTAAFSVVATGTAPLSYQWQKNGANIAGATSASYTTPATTTADNGSTFKVVISNSAGTGTSNAATLTVNPAPVVPTITTQPANQTVTAGQTATFSVVATGASPLTYQWQKNGANIAGATSASYTTPATTASDSGSTFKVVVTNSAGTATSNSATLTVNAAVVAPSITTQPVNQTVTAGQTATFAVTATGTAPLGYQWQKNGANISGATSASYTTPATTTSDSGSTFVVVVSNGAGTATSNAATLTVNAAAVAPSITTQPANQTVTAGQTATFTVTASGTAPLSYQWQKNGANIAGATSASYTTPPTATSDSGSTFDVVVSNTAASATSNAATLTVNPSSGGKFPIKASANNRYFVDATGAPWMMVADAAHHMMPAIPQSAVAAYLTDRVGHGFNAIDFYFMCAGAGTCPASGAAFDHTLPFTSGSGPSTYDLSTPTPAYWAEVDSVISQAAADGLVVFVNPIPWGVAFSSTLQNNGAMKDFNFGAFLGNRYKNSPNIIWHVGQDFQSWNSSSSDLNDEAQLMAGIRSADPNHLLMSQLSYPGSYSSQANSLNATFAANLTANFVYSYRETYDEVLQAYNSSPTLPAVLGEANYETGNNLGGLSSAASAYTTREEMWWTMTSGATGHAFGNEHVNHFDSVYTSNLDTTATSQVHYLTDLFATRSWWTFAPDQAHAVVTAGYGTYNGSNENLYSGTYATTTWDGGTTSITYTPVSTTLTVDMSKFSKLMNASWYDPTTGASTTITGSPFANSGTQTFTTPPAAHADGTHDWVLVLQ